MGSKRPVLTPQFEHDLLRDPRLGYESPNTSEFVRCIEHGSPTPLERWHCHDECELQLIVGARGRAFVGDYFGHFEPGHLVLTGPRLPHNWISTDLPPNGLEVRSLVIQFREEPLREGMRAIKELEEARPLLERARRGIEFFGLSESVRDRFYRIKRTHGLQRFAEFADLLCLLQNSRDYRLLSSDSTVVVSPINALSTINEIIEYVNENYGESLSLSDVAVRVNMSEDTVSRYFKKATDSTFTTFVNRVRVHKACELLMHSERQISGICYEVGFNNMANFNRRFREIKGTTPSEFRRQSMDRLGREISPGAQVRDASR
ncbi:HTH-type transcriptional activator RhaS [Paraburkholderia sediminicola]|uniref:HTH-type transcriptional activator RhaS n=1 Tax=Paraburkholderia sediminicola TaxID=458836 RepID=A0A6J5CQQ9_9BURK|nr:AraC family transcriptional regulator [Paraburkholderia sediminicola]CAB3743812.1 HTH-type transcriptional activator RhaS [Paraburkholderia sediminicola]